MYQGSCQEKIIASMESLTNAERKIADFVLENYEKVLSSNITELAEYTTVSEATIVRFCRSLGYKGYQDFKIKAALDVLPKERHYNPALSKDDTPRTICEKIFSTEISVLSRTLAGLDMGVIESAVQYIFGAKRVFFFGSGGSLLVGKDALHKLMKIGIQAYVYEDRDMQMMSSSLITDQDVAIGISHSGSNYGVIKCLEQAKDNGAKTIALVGHGKTPISKMADLSISISTEQTIFQSEVASTRIAQLAILDAITAILAFKNYDYSYRAIQGTRRATSENKL